MSTTRNLNRYGHVSRQNFANINEFTSRALVDGISTIDYHGSPLDILVRTKPGAHTTIVTFHPAVPSAGATLPMFMGQEITDIPGSNTVFIADPSLELDSELAIAWFAGNSRQPLQSDLPRILRHILKSLGSRHTIFYGASAGGFAALYYGAQIAKSLVIAVNPQTDILEYNSVFTFAYARSCWGATDSEETVTLLRTRTFSELTSVYGKETGTTLLYVQNRTDWHVKRHMDPFLASMPHTQGLYRLMGDWGKGHFAPPPAVQRKALVAAVIARGSWNTAFDELVGVEIVQAKKPHWLTIFRKMSYQLFRNS